MLEFFLFKLISRIAKACFLSTCVAYSSTKDIYYSCLEYDKCEKQYFALNFYFNFTIMKWGCYLVYIL